MTKALIPNVHGLVVVTLTKDYGSNVAGDRAGFLPDIARQLVEQNYATSFAPAEAQHAIEGELLKREQDAGGANGSHVVVRKEEADSKGNPTPSGNDAQTELEQAEVTTRTFTKSQAKKAGIETDDAKAKAKAAADAKAKADAEAKAKAEADAQAKAAAANAAL